MNNPNDNEFDLDSFLNGDVETFSRSTTDSIDSIGVFDEEDVILGMEIPDEEEEEEEVIESMLRI